MKGAQDAAKAPAIGVVKGINLYLLMMEMSQKRAHLF